MNGLFTPALCTALGPTRAAQLEASLQKRLALGMATLDAQHEQHKAELAELINGWDDRLTKIERRATHAAKAA